MLPATRRQRDISFCAVAAAVVATLSLGVIVNARFVHLDLAAVYAADGLALSGATQAMIALTNLGGSGMALSIMVLAAICLLMTRHWHAALGVVLSVAATQAVVDLIKTQVERSRPPASAAQVETVGYSFPSAHSATSAALYGVLALVAIGHLKGAARIWASAAAVGLVLAIGATRVYLGAHYPTDVLAGWLVGAVIAVGAWRLAEASRRVIGRLVPALA